MTEKLKKKKEKKEKRVAAPGGKGPRSGTEATERGEARKISSGAMAQSAANGVDQDLASKRLHSR